jgi:hypothetical protein
MLRQKRRSVRHWISARYGPITSLGSDEGDEAWLRQKNRDIMEVTHVFNAIHVYTITKDPNTFVKVPCLPEFVEDGHDWRGGHGNAGDGCEDLSDDSSDFNAETVRTLDARAGLENERFPDEWEDTEDELA